MKKACDQCPFRKDVAPFLHPERASEIANHTWNPYNTFPCHKTLEYDNNEDELCTTEKSKQCAGFITLGIAQFKRTNYPEFIPDFEIIYPSIQSMEEAYQDDWDGKRSNKQT